MPETRTFGGQVQDLRPQDKLDRVGPSGLVSGKRLANAGHVVLDTKVGRSNVTVNLDGGTVVAALDTYVEYARSVETEDEKREKLEAQLTREIDLALEHVAKWADADPKAGFIKRLEETSNRGLVDRIAWTVEGAMEEGIKFEIGSMIKSILESVDAGDHTLTRAELFDAMVEDSRKYVMSHARIPESSTSTPHNLVARLKLKVHADLLDDFAVKGVFWLREKLA